MRQLLGFGDVFSLSNKEKALLDNYKNLGMQKSDLTASFSLG